MNAIRPEDLQQSIQSYGHLNGRLKADLKHFLTAYACYYRVPSEETELEAAIQADFLEETAQSTLLTLLNTRIVHLGN